MTERLIVAMHGLVEGLGIALFCLLMLFVFVFSFAVHFIKILVAKEERQRFLKRLFGRVRRDNRWPTKFS